MKGFAEIEDPVAGRIGHIRYDRRESELPTAPLVLIGGTTQTVSSWASQIRPLSSKREVIAYETRGQGETELSLAEASLERHVVDFASLVAALDLRAPLDLCGFSYGGRVALAIAATRPELCRRLVLSGVGMERSVAARLIVDGWMAALRTGDLDALARVSLPDILGPKFLQKNEALIESMVSTAVERNRYEGVKALLEEMVDLPEDSPWRTAYLATQLHCPVLAMTGELDRLAPPAGVKALAKTAGGRAEVLDGVGHTIPIEAAALWRTHVEAFLDG